jgi:hypothetical protein
MRLAAPMPRQLACNIGRAFAASVSTSCLVLYQPLVLLDRDIPAACEHCAHFTHLLGYAAQRTCQKSAESRALKSLRFQVHKQFFFPKAPKTLFFSCQSGEANREKEVGSDPLRFGMMNSGIRPRAARLPAYARWQQRFINLSFCAKN